MKKRIISLLMALVMAVSLLPVSAFAEGEPPSEPTGDAVVETVGGASEEGSTDGDAKSEGDNNGDVDDNANNGGNVDNNANNGGDADANNGDDGDDANNGGNGGDADNANGANNANNGDDGDDANNTNNGGADTLDGEGNGSVTTGVPVLVEGVTDRTVTVQTKQAYQLEDLMNGKIFQDPNGGTLKYTNYFYQLSTDDGETWGEKTGFQQMEFGGVNSSLSQSVAGTYIYRFYAENDAGRSTQTWTLTLIFSDVVTENVNFYVGRDQNYSTNGNKYPVLELYKTAGIDEKQFDYVGWFTNAEGKTEYVYNPKDYTITEGETNYVTVNGAQYVLHDYEKITFTNSKFDATAEDATASGTVVNNYNMFYAALETGRYSTRGYGWNTETNAYDIYLGGQSMPLPMEKDIYGGGGNDIHLGVVGVYVTTKNSKDEYFTADDYYAEMIMPVTGSMIHAGVPYTYTRFSSNYTAYPFLSYEAGNASLYNIYAYPKDTEKYMFNQSINNTTNASYSVVTKSVTIASAIIATITVPKDAEFGLYFQFNNFNTKPVDVLETVENTDGTKTISYRISQSNGNYTWRLTDPSGKYVTKAGWLASAQGAFEKTITFGDGAATDKKTHDFSQLGSTVSSRDEADLQAFLTPSGFMSTSNTYRIRAYRMWQLINSDTANIMVEPEFNVQMLQGSKDDVQQVNGGNAKGNWIDVTPSGTDIVAVTYDAIDMYATDDTHKTHGGLFPASAPERTGVFVITNEAAGTADAQIAFNGSKETDRGSEWDYNYDTWYYLDTDKAPTLDFTVTAGAQVSYAVVTTDAGLKSTLSGWTSITADSEGVYHADMLKFRNAKTLGGTVIIKMTDATGTSYRLVRVAEMSVTYKNASHSGEPIMPGDNVTLSFGGLYRGVDKVSGIFNPLTYYLRYSAGEKEAQGTLSQYQQMNRVSVTLTVPADMTFPEGKGTADYTFTNGYLYGSMYAASSPFRTLYDDMTDVGVGTNFSAVGVSFVLTRLADVTVPVVTKVYYDVELDITDENGKVDGADVTLKDSSGKAVTAGEDGIYHQLGFGKYTYSIVKTGYVCYNGEFTLGSADTKDVKDGKLVKSIKLTKAAEGAWDGKTTSEPKTDGDGVYQISNGAELAWFAQKVNGGSTKISGVLTKDIDLAAYPWTPIGTSSKNFAGSFDGQNHKVYNLLVDYRGTTRVPPYQGLFGWVSGTASQRVTIQNLTVQGSVTVTSSHKNVTDANSGGVIGRADYADITNVHANVDVTVNRVGGNWQNVGGVVGLVYYSVNVKNCSNSGTIKGWRYAAGIVGNINSGNGNSSIINCVNTGVVSCPSTCAAGIVANLSSGCKVSGCYNTGAITAGGNYAAGIVGYCSNAEVSNCYNIGMIKCNPAFAYGSVIGTVTNAAAVIKNLYYLEGTCDKGGIGSVKDEATQTAESVTKAELNTDEFVGKLNADLAEKAFKASCGYPVLVWQTAKEHVYDQEVVSDEYLKSPATRTKRAEYYKSCICGLTDKENAPTFESGMTLQEVEDKAAADDVIAKINGIGTVTRGSKSAISAARKAYEALTDDQKALISADVLAVLTEAEAAYEELVDTTGGHRRYPANSSAGSKADDAKSDAKTDGKNVKSGDTGDAGIALYAAMSLLSLTGGALVFSRKRKDD